MKLTELTMAMAMGLTVVAGAAHAADQGHGTVTFEGSIVDAPCSITGDSVDQTVQLGHVAAHALENGGTSTPSKFKIKLAQCDVTTATKGVSITFTGTPDKTATGNLAFGVGSTAKGASIAIADSKGKTISLDTASDPVSLNNGDNVLNFQAYLEGYKPAGDATQDAVTPGSFSSVANFTLAYN